MTRFRDHLFAVILAGGGGTRLWPLSRKKNPKQFIKLLGERTLLQETGRRFAKLIPWERIWIVTTSSLYAKEIEKELPRIEKDHILVEPVARGTALAHGLAAAYILKIDREAVILNEYADHLVSPLGEYLETLLVAAQAAHKTRSLVAIGIKPEYPHVGMGHIKVGKIKHRIKGKVVYKVRRFVEKPPLALARRFTKAGDYYWNGGMYVWRADSILDSLKKHTPKVGRGLEFVSETIGKENEKEALAKVYKGCPTISIDYAVSEKEKKFLMVPASFSWNDVGDWKVVWELSHKDKEGNVLIRLNKRGQWLGLATTDSLIQTERLLIATVGLSNVIIVETKDALLIAQKDQVEKVKEIVNRLKEEKKDEFL